MTLGPQTISGCVIARDEEAVIDRCLSSLDGVVDELILVHDGPCSDRTLEIAEHHGARVFVRPVSGNPEAHTVFAYEQARGEWLLNIDADEYLSEPLRAALPGLVARTDVNGFEFLWRVWDGSRYLTENGPFKLALHRRAATHLLGMLQSVERIDGVVEHLPLELEHRPLYNNYALSSILTKWRRWARVHARELTGPYEALPKFNWTGPWRWPWWRRPLNLLAPVLLPAYLGALFATFLRGNAGRLPVRENLRAAAFQTCYAALVQLYVIREVYGRASRRR
jgi:glycosyltransferase involved in cell wall biosynthesis